MKKRHALGISALVGLAVVAASFAAVRSVQARDPGGSPPASPSASAAVQPSALDRYEARLDAALAALRARSADAVAPAPSSASTTSQDIEASGRGESDDAYEHENDDHGGDRFESEWEDD